MQNVEKVFEAYMSLCSVTEKLHFSSASIRRAIASTRAAGWRRRGRSEVLELPLAQALQAIREGTIVDAKTIMLLQFVALNRTLEEER